MTTSGAPREASRSANSFSTSARLLASQVNARPPMSLTSGSRSPVVRAASATLIPSLASARASDALSPEPAPTMSALLKRLVVMIWPCRSLQRWSVFSSGATAWRLVHQEGEKRLISISDAKLEEWLRLVAVPILSELQHNMPGYHFRKAQGQIPTRIALIRRREIALVRWMTMLRLLVLRPSTGT